MFKTNQKFGYCIGIDIVGFSRESASQQVTLFKKLNCMLLRNGIRCDQLINSGDGVFIVFMKPDNDVEKVLAKALLIHAACIDREIPIRMGIGAGVIIPVRDAQCRANYIGDGINLTERIMNCGDKKHILMSEFVAFEAEANTTVPEGYSIVSMGEYMAKHSSVLGIYALVKNPKDENTCNPNLNVPMKNKINWSALQKISPDIVFPEVGVLKSLDTILPEDLKNTMQFREDEFEYVVAKAEIHLRRENGAVAAYVQIDDYPFIATESEGRKKLERDEVMDRHGMSVLIEGFKRGRLDSVTFNGRFSAGGAIGVIECKEGTHIIVIERDKHAPSYKNALCPASGLSENLEEWLHPDYIIYREFMEELLIVNHNKNLVPDVNGTSGRVSEIICKEHSKTLAKIRRLAEGNCDLEKVLEFEKDSVNANLLQLGKDKIYISWGNKKSEPITGNIVIDSEIGVIDIIGAIKITLKDCSINDLRIIDTETFKDKDKEGVEKFTHRRILLFEKEEFCKLSIPGEKAEYAKGWQKGVSFGKGDLPETPKVVPPLLDSIKPLAIALEVDVNIIDRIRDIQNNERSFLPDK